VAVTGSILYDALFRAAGLFCHQLPERSPHLWGAQLPLCWRCTGIALGACALLAWLVARRELPPLALSLLLALALPLEVLYSALAAGSNPRRLATGLAWGFFAFAASLDLLRRLAARRDPLRDDARARAST
jgi:uncharacterized membrane protein